MYIYIYVIMYIYICNYVYIYAIQKTFKKLWKSMAVSRLENALLPWWTMRW